MTTMLNAQAAMIARKIIDHTTTEHPPVTSVIVLVALAGGGYAAQFISNNHLECRGLLEASVDGLREQLGYALRVR